MIEFDEQLVRCRDEVVVVGQVVGSQGQTADKFGQELRPIEVRKGIEFVEQLFGRLSHEIRFAFSVLGVKFLSVSTTPHGWAQPATLAGCIQGNTDSL
jgi:hypothetical protein